MPKYGIGTQPKWVQTAEQTKMFVLPAGVSTTSAVLSKIVSTGYSFSCLIYYSVSLLIKTGVPFHTICTTSAGGSSEISTYM